MSVFRNIQAALDTTLSTVPSISDIAWESVEYTTKFGMDFVRPTLLPARSVLETLAGANKNTGIYQVDIFSYSGDGKGAGLTVADSIKTHFESNRRIVAGSNIIWIMQISLGKGVQEGSFYHIFLEINYYCLS